MQSLANASKVSKLILREVIYSILFILVLNLASTAFDGNHATADEYNYLPAGIKLDPKITAPEQHLGFKVGERHLQHHQLISYLKRLSIESSRIEFRIYEYTHGGRPCVMLSISSPENLKRSNTIRTQHRNLTHPKKSESVDLKRLPAVINMGYGVHGDESSASNSAAVVAYYLAAAQGKEIDSILKNCFILLDPCLNPDGFNRFASWANGHVGRIQNPDPAHAEHIQPFPGGRVNYYWFDLNRDWLPAQHPESRGRLKQYHAWKPNVVLDFHEMGTSSTYFFQPGIPARNNPLTPSRNIELTEKMAKYHAAALDKIGSLYMTEERFDDFYMGKGSTYPDLHGAVGILFEQASSRGHRQESPNGELTFPFTIRNQVRTSLSSLKATTDLRMELLEYKRKFYRESLKLAWDAEFTALEFRTGTDRTRLGLFADILQRHDIAVFEKMEEGETVLVVPARQPEYRFLLSLVEKRTQFKENVFYDVSTWHLPSAFDVKMKMLDVFNPVDLKRRSAPDAPTRSEERQSVRKIPKALAYIIDWRSQSAPATVGQLLRNGIKLRVAMKAFSIAGATEPIHFPHGTVLLPLGIQPDKSALALKILKESSVPVTPVQTGLTPEGIDLGSNQFAPIELPRTAMVVGSGVNRYEAGEVWHLFDTRLKLPLTLIDASRLGRTRLDRYNNLILVGGNYSSIGESTTAKLKSWVANGGNLTLISSSINWANAAGIAKVEMVADPPETQAATTDASEKLPIQLPFASARNNRALQLISGAIFRTKVDLTHPLGFGFDDSNLPVFRNNRVILKPSDNPYSNPVVYTDDPQIAGYCSEENVAKLRQSAGVITAGSGAGTVIIMPQNPNFRAFWWGSQRLMINSVFFGRLSK